MKERVQKGMFFGFSSIDQLAMMIANTQLEVPATSKGKHYANLEALVEDDWACHGDDVVAVGSRRGDQ